MLRGKGANVILLALVLTTAAATYALEFHNHSAAVLTGVVETTSLGVSPPLAGTVDRLLVSAGDQVTRDQLIALVIPAESSPTLPPHVQPVKDTRPPDGLFQELVFEDHQASDAIDLANRSIEATSAQQLDAENARTEALIGYERLESLAEEGLVARSQVDEAKAAYDEALARVDALAQERQVEQSALALAQSNAHHVDAERVQLARADQSGAASEVPPPTPPGHVVREVRAPIDGVVDTEPVHEGSAVTVSDLIVTLINPDDLWVRADIARSDADRIHLGDRLMVRVASGEQREGTVFYRGEANGARDVVEIRLRIDNRDRSLEPGVPAYVTLSAPSSLRPAP